VSNGALFTSCHIVHILGLFSATLWSGVVVHIAGWGVYDEALPWPSEWSNTRWAAVPVLHHRWNDNCRLVGETSDTWQWLV